MNFLQKVRAVTLGASHDLLDKTIDMNSPSVLRQYVRDLEAAIDKMKTETAVQDGTLRTLNRESADLTNTIATDRATVAKLLASPDVNAPALAKARASVILTNQSRLNAMQADIETQKAALEKMQAAVVALEAKHETIVARVRELERLDRDSKSKEQAAAAISNAGSIVNMTSNQSIDDLTSRMQARHDVADAKFEQAMGGMQAESEDSDAVNALLAELQPKAVAQ
jgi:phage shock protein A